jgi:hypothetical protein
MSLRCIRLTSSEGGERNSGITFQPGSYLLCIGDGETPEAALDDLRLAVAAAKPAISPNDPLFTADTMGALWLRAEQALPPKWTLHVWGPNRTYERPYAADANGPGTQKVRGMGFNPVEAIEDLLHLLRERNELTR